MIHQREMLGNSVGVQLLDQEVGYASVKLQGCGGGHRAGAIVGLNPHVVSLCHSGNLFGFHNAAGVSDIGLQDVGGVQLQYASKAVARVDPLARGDGDVNLIRDLLQSFDIERIDGLFQEHDVVLFQAPTQPDDGVGSKLGAHVQHEVDLGSDGAAYGLHAFDSAYLGFAIDRAVRDV